MRPFGPPPPPPTRSSSARAVSADGLVIAGTMPGNGQIRGYRWSGRTGFEYVNGATPVGISAKGDVLAANANRYAYRWTRDTGLVSLGELAGGAPLALALGAGTQPAQALELDLRFLPIAPRNRKLGCRIVGHNVYRLNKAHVLVRSHFPDSRSTHNYTRTRRATRD